MTLPLGTPKARSCALQPCKVQVVINEIYDVQPKAESQMWPVVRSATRHAELGAVPVSPPIHPSSLQSPVEFHTARSHLVAHEVVPAASSSSPSSISSWSSSSCDSLIAGDNHKVVSDRSASDQSESSCSAREPSSIDMRHEVPSVSLVRPQVIFPAKTQQLKTVAALTGPAVKGASTAQESSKVKIHGNSFCIPSLRCKDYLARFLSAPLRLTLPVSMVFTVCACFWLPMLLHGLITTFQIMLHIGLVCLSQPMLLCLAVHHHHDKAASDPQPKPPLLVLSWRQQHQH